MPQSLPKTIGLSYRPSSGLLDAVNLRLLAELQADPRLPMTELGRRAGMSSPAVTERVRRLEEAGVIRGYRLDIDPAALGLPLMAFIRVRPNPGQLPRVAELAQAIPEVVECHRITGEDCFIVKVHLPAMDQLDHILDRFLLLGTTTTSIVQSTPVQLRPVPVDGVGSRESGVGSRKWVMAAGILDLGPNSWRRLMTPDSRLPTPDSRLAADREAPEYAAIVLN